MKKIWRVLLYAVLGIAGLVILGFAYFHISYAIKNSRAKSRLAEKPVLEENGFRYRDLNNNGSLDVYEDSRQAVEARVSDVLAQMTIEEKVGLMWHPPIGVGDEGEILGKPSPTRFFFSSTYDYLINKKLRTFNLFQVPETRFLAQWHNNLQKIAEQDRLGIPVTISSDPRHGTWNFLASDMLGGDWSEWPEPIGLAATNDSLLVFQFARIARTELRSVGISTALHPMADLATEPRWARINGTFGEDADLAAKITAAYVLGFQGERLGQNSVATMVKHWPGGGPQRNGWDAHFRYGAEQYYPGDNFDYHLRPFEAAFEAGAAMVMPYYGIPLGQTSQDVGMSFNKEIIQGLLRERYGFHGLVCTDWGIVEGFKMLGFEIFEGTGWGVDDLSVKERVKKVIDAGADQFGGNTNTEELLELIEEGSISEGRIDESARRILRTKFQLGLFDDPYVDAEEAVGIVGSEEHMEMGRLVQRKSIVLLKNEMRADSSYALPLARGLNIYVENIDQETASDYANVVDDLDEADVAVLRLQAPWEPREGMIEGFFHQGDLDFKEPELSRILDITQRVPTIVAIYLDRPAVIPEIVERAVGLLGEFGASDDAVLDIVFGEFNPTARLPFELPSSMEAVENQFEDVPYDSKDPVFKFGHGLSYETESDSLATEGS
ncbi:MAG: glycoside hydrolase family 3 C-terminal domain-containing protein [Gemmatimonadota bacterium]|nr:MAG: glycoside hydrolase family 3 C-terminal domain-containing protein [Gemmatimonadota bacterium]